MDPSPSAGRTEEPPVRDAAPVDAAPGARPRAAPFAGLTSLRWRGVPVLTLGLLGFAVSVVVGNYLPTRALTAATTRQLEAQRRENRESAERIRHAEAEAARLESDPWATERILRDEFRMTRKGEVIVR